MPVTVAVLANWPGDALPDEAMFEALITDLRNARSNGLMLSIAKRMSYEDNRYRSLIMSTLRKVPAEGPVREALISALPLWGIKHLAIAATGDSALDPLLPAICI